MSWILGIVFLRVLQHLKADIFLHFRMNGGWEMLCKRVIQPLESYLVVVVFRFAHQRSKHVELVSHVLKYLFW